MDSAGTTKDGGFGVKLVRGPFLQLPPHPGHVKSPAALAGLCRSLKRGSPGTRLAADLFSGAGGLSLGLHQAGVEVVLGVDHYAEAVKTHAHHFPGLSVDWDLSEPDRIEQVASLMRECGITVLAGGPPCQPFSKAGRSGIRHLVRNGQRESHDQRRDLWRSFMEVVDLARPAAVLMENVPDMALDPEMFILRTMVEEFEVLGYSVEVRVVDSWRYGVPQFRQRLIVVALADGVQYRWPAESDHRVTVWNAIGDLPPVEGGWRPAGGEYGWAGYEAPQTAFQRKMREGVPEADSRKVFDHITRPVRADDAQAFALMSPDTKYSELPDEFKRYRDDIFDDKYKRLDENDVSRTITAHIAKDGYWYIHPRQGRTITVREAARIQTFPDWYRFNGPPSAAFKQIGNAVPPLLGRHLARSVLTSLAEGAARSYSTRELAGAVSTWFTARDKLTVPWLRGNRWQVIQAGVLLDRLTAVMVPQAWAVIEGAMTKPEETLENRDVVRAVGRLIGRSAKAELVISLAQIMADEPDLPDEGLIKLPGVNQTTAAMAVLVDGLSEEEPVTSGAGISRVAARFSGTSSDIHNKFTDGRLAIARMIGNGKTSRSAQLGLIELAAAICVPDRPRCGECPLEEHCLTAQLRPSRTEVEGMPQPIK